MPQSLSQIFLRGAAVTRSRSGLWVLQAIPIVLFIGGVYLIARTSIIPLFGLYVSLSDVSYLDVTALSRVPEQLRLFGYTIVPAVVGFVLLRIVFISAMYRCVIEEARGAPLSLRRSVGQGGRYFGVILGLSIVTWLIYALILFGGSAIFRSFDVSSGVALILSTLILACVALLFLFSWPAIVAYHMSIGSGVRLSAQIVLRNIWGVCFVAAVFFALHVIFICLLGAVAGIAYYVHVLPAVILGMLVVAASIPIRAWMHAVRMLMCIALSQGMVSNIRR